MNRQDNIRQWQANNPELVKKLRGAMPKLARLQNNILEEMVDAVEELDPDIPFSAGEFVHEHAHRIQMLQVLVATVAEMSAEIPEPQPEVEVEVNEDALDVHREFEQATNGIEMVIFKVPEAGEGLRVPRVWAFPPKINDELDAMLNHLAFEVQWNEDHAIISSEFWKRLCTLLTARVESLESRKDTPHEDQQGR